MRARMRARNSRTQFAHACVHTCTLTQVVVVVLNGASFFAYLQLSW
jgi:integral membrane sensor domain MASE1